jgi:hypothetical protein
MAEKDGIIEFAVTNRSGQYIKLIIGGGSNDALLMEVEDFVKRQRVQNNASVREHKALYEMLKSEPLAVDPQKLEYFIASERDICGEDRGDGSASHSAFKSEAIRSAANEVREKQKSIREGLGVEGYGG